MSLCQYQDILGSPGLGLHSIRLFDVPVVDYILTIILTIAISNIPKFKSYIPNLLTRLLIIFSVLMVVAAILHKLFCVKSNLTF